MTIKNPIVHNMALLLDEIAEADPELESIRALYMVTQNVHKLKVTPNTQDNIWGVNRASKFSGK